MKFKVLRIIVVVLALLIVCMLFVVVKFHRAMYVEPSLGEQWKHVPKVFPPGPPPNTGQD